MRVSDTLTEVDKSEWLDFVTQHRDLLPDHDVSAISCPAQERHFDADMVQRARTWRYSEFEPERSNKYFIDKVWGAEQHRSMGSGC